MTTDTPTDAELLAEIRRVCTDFADSHQVSGVLLRLLDARDVRIAELEQELYTMTNTARHHLDDRLAMEAERDRLAAALAQAEAARNSAQSLLGHLPSCQLQRISSGGPSRCNCGLSAEGEKT